MNTRKLFILCVCLLAICFLQAQDKIPQAISYQAVARDAQGKVVSEKTISVKVEILKGSADGSVVFSETHTPTSSKTGTVNLLIGQGSNVNGAFASIDWGADTYFLQLSMDLAGGNNYEKVSTTQMLPVPYALYAAKAGEVENGGNGGESTGGVADFALIPFGDGSDNSSTNVPLLEGDFVKTTSYGLFISYYVLYLDGKDQDVKLEISGVPETSYQIEMSKGSNNGRSIRASIGDDYDQTELPAGTYDITFTLINSTGLKKEYKCKFIKTTKEN